MDQPTPLCPARPNPQETMRHLRQLPGLKEALAVPLPAGRLHCSLFAPGLPLGALIHLSGPRRTEAMLTVLAEHPGLRAAWVEERITAYPPALERQGVDLGQLLFVEARRRDFFWALTQVVRSQLFKVVLVASSLRGEGVSLRQLQLAGEQAGCAVVLIGDIEGPAWSVRLWLATETGGGGLSLRQRRDPLDTDGDDAVRVVSRGGHA